MRNRQQELILAFGIDQSIQRLAQPYQVVKIVILAIELHFTLIEYCIDIPAGVIENLFIQGNEVSRGPQFVQSRKPRFIGSALGKNQIHLGKPRYGKGACTHRVVIELVDRRIAIVAQPYTHRIPGIVRIHRIDKRLGRLELIRTRRGHGISIEYVAVVVGARVVRDAHDKLLGPYSYGCRPQAVGCHQLESLVFQKGARNGLGLVVLLVIQIHPRQQCRSSLGRSIVIITGRSGIFGRSLIPGSALADSHLQIVFDALPHIGCRRAQHHVFGNLSHDRNIAKLGHQFQITICPQIVKRTYHLHIALVGQIGLVRQKINDIVEEVEQESKQASLIFQPEAEEVFAVDKGQNAVLVNRDQLYQEIDNALKTSKKVKIEIPIIEIENQINVEALKDSVVMRSEFSTSYATSSSARKNNVKKALESFNGMIVEPGETVSFNETTGPRTEAQGYKNAHIIVGGVYVDGVGGGVCQASTTLYNALILADVEILSVNHHSLPASYVPLSFDAMVSGSYSDLVFKNTLDNPIYIKTSADENNVTVQIYGQKFEDGMSIKKRAELIKILPHNGDKIVADTKGEYSNRILYKGEYLRIKYPREGYESKGYLEYYKNGELVEEKEIRHDYYLPQDGVVMEGVETPAEGMIIPASDVKIIKPQKVTKANEDAVKNKLEKTNPSEFNP